MQATFEMQTQLFRQRPNVVGGVVNGMPWKRVPFSSFTFSLVFSLFLLCHLLRWTRGCAPPIAAPAGTLPRDVVRHRPHSHPDQRHQPQLVPAAPPSATASSSLNTNDKLFANTLLQSPRGLTLELDKASVVSGPVQDFTELHCFDFDERCRWRNVEGFLIDELDWYQGAGYLDEDRLKLTTKTKRTPDGFYTIAASDKAESPLNKAILISDIIECQQGQSELRLNYWTSPKVKLYVCTKLVSKIMPFYDYCTRPFVAGGPGPAIMSLPDLDGQPFQILILASNFVYNSESLLGGFAIIDNIEYSGELCKTDSENGILSLKTAPSSSSLSTHGFLQTQHGVAQNGNNATKYEMIKQASNHDNSTSSFISSTFPQFIRTSPIARNTNSNNYRRSATHLNDLMDWLISSFGKNWNEHGNKPSSSSSSSFDTERLRTFVSGLGRQLGALSTLAPSLSIKEIDETVAAVTSTTFLPNQDGDNSSTAEASIAETSTSETLKEITSTFVELSSPSSAEESMQKSFPIDATNERPTPRRELFRIPKIKIKNHKVVPFSSSAETSSTADGGGDERRKDFGGALAGRRGGGVPMPHMQLVALQKQQNKQDRRHTTTLPSPNEGRERGVTSNLFGSMAWRVSKHPSAATAPKNSNRRTGDDESMEEQTTN